MPTRHAIIAPSSSDQTGTAGVNMRVNPQSLGSKALASAVNLVFEEGRIKTRPGFNYQNLKVDGQFQGALHYAPSKGVSARPFADRATALVVAVNGKIRLYEATFGQISCGADPLCGDYDFCGKGVVHLFQAENWLIVQNRLSNTYFWRGDGCLTPSPGMAGCENIDDPEVPLDTPFKGDCTKGGHTSQQPPGSSMPGTSLTSQTLPTSGSSITPPSSACGVPTTIAPHGGEEALEITQSSHDSFCPDKHSNWLINAAGLGIYAHGRVHQEGDYEIYVGDMIHKRGYLETDDILKMEEQALDSMGDTLTANSTLGELKALELLPAMNTANGEGDLVAYYEGGVVFFDTFKFPRETRSDGEGKTIQKGWEFERMVDHKLNQVSAVGRYAVSRMPRDHFFRSVSGLHFLKSVLGEGSFQPEYLNRISHNITPILDNDSVEDLEGAATGVWVQGARLLATVGLRQSECHGVLSSGQGFVSLNQATTFSEDRTPKFIAEGHWVLDHGMHGVHQFLQLGNRPEKGSFGFIATDRDADNFFASIEPDYSQDYRDGQWLPIEWSFTTGQTKLGNGLSTAKLTEGVLEGAFSSQQSRLKVWVRTDKSGGWALWQEFGPKDRSLKHGQHFETSLPLGQPPASHREATWFQFKVEGLDYAEIHSFRIEIEEVRVKTGQRTCVAVSFCDDDPFIINNEPCKNRWPQT